MVAGAANYQLNRGYHRDVIPAHQSIKGRANALLGALGCLLLPLGALAAGTISEQIIVDQFGWRANAPRKVVIFADPITGQNEAVSYTPGASFQLRRVADEAIIFTGSTVAWNSGATDTVSGDKVWYGDFTSVTTPGEYYIYDPTNDQRSYAFKLDNGVFNDVLKASIRMYYYQRTGTSIPVQYGGNWSRGLTHIGPGQDNEALLWQGNAAVPGTQRDVSGGWFDAGDFNKYTPWAAGLLWDLLTAYEWNPTAFNDSYNIPESGNGVPDALDEFKWCLDWLLKMQLTNGAVLNRVGDGAGGRYYTPATTWATASFAAAMAHASRVYAPFDSVYPGYSTTLLNAATNAWNYLSVTPTMTPTNGTDGATGVAVAAAGSNADEDFRLRVLAAAELWRTTGNATYKTYFEANYNAPGSYSGTSHPLYGGWPHFDPTGFMELNRAFVTYAMTPGANPTIVALIKSSLYNMTSSIAGNYASSGRHAYRSYVWDYFWGSNGVKSHWANVLQFAIKLNVGSASERTQYREIAEEYLHYIHGRNPLSQLYLSNMGTKGANLGGDKSAMELWHGSFFGAQYDGINSTYGPAPGFLVGGPNRYYSVTTVSPPYGQPPSKSYKDWNTGWPESSWEITEPSIGYQSGFCLLLSQFAVNSGTAPSSLAATPVSSSQINLTWSDNSTDEDSFELQRANDTSFSSGLVTTMLSSNVTSASATGLTPSTTYYFRVRATNSFGVSAYSSTSSATPSDRRAIYAFEGGAQDSSASGNHGTATAVSYVIGKVGAQAAQFNGTTSYVSIPRSVTDDFTVAMWVKTTDNAGWAGAQWWNGKGLVDGEVGGGGADWGTALVDGKFVIGIGATGGDSTFASSVNINNGAWHHVAATRNNTSGAVALYVDGVLRGSGTGANGSRTFPANLRIGGIQAGGGFLNGTLDDVRLYDRILTVGEIAGLIAPPAAPTNLVATIGDASVALSWSASPNATSYYLKRSLTSSGYATIATNTSLTFTNTGLSNGTLYYFIVSAVGPAGEGTNSVAVSARPTSFTPTQISCVAAGNQLQLDWPADHTGWQLQSQTNSLATGLGTNWVNIPGSALTNQITMPVNPASGAVFFRLVRP
jgi:endoglucanase